MDGTEAESEPATAGSTPESTSTDQRKVSLVDVRRRLEAEKKRIANLRRNRVGSKSSAGPKSPKATPNLKRRGERRSTSEIEVKKKKVTPPKASSSASADSPAGNRKKSPKSAVKSPVETREEVEEEPEEATVDEPAVDETVENPLAEKPDSPPDDTQISASKDEGGVGLPSDTEYVIGYKLEAKDFNNDWYPARVVEVDYDDREVLVHFERWSVRYDEWISMDSLRLRPPGPLSKAGLPVKPVKSTPKAKTPVAVPTAAETATPVVEKPCRKYKKDETVMASWSDSRKYPAKVIDVLGNDMYNVLFFDGFSKCIKANRMTPGRPGVQMEPTNVAPPPVLPTTLYPADEDIGSKADRRERKRKHTVTELFSLKPRTSTGSSNTPTKTSPSTNKSTPASAVKPSPATSGKAEGPAAKRSKTKSQTPKQNPGQEDLLLIKSLSGAGLEGTKASKSRSPAVDARRVRTLLPRARNDDSPIIEPPPPHNPCTKPLEIPSPAQPASILEGMEIEMVGDNFKCPNEECGKLYRKENLLQMHIKHYHPELKSLLVVVPKVLDLAYARTVGDLPSTAVTPRSSHAPSSTPVATSSTISTPSVRKSFTPQVVLKKPAKTAEKSEKNEKQGPAEDKDASPTSAAEIKSPVSLPPPPPPVSSSPSKTGHIKTLLPVNRSPVKQNDGSRDHAAKDKPPTAPLSALQQALMSPPGHLAAQMMHHNTHENKHRSPVKTEVKPHFVSPQRGTSGSPRKGREEKSPNKELVNCKCGVAEEDGLMIQCDICMCWQHGICNHIETDDEVPDKYVCHICLNPARQRTSRKYAHDQDWLKEGILPRMPIRRNQARVVRTSTEMILKESHDITATIVRLQEVIHSLRVKINIAEKADHPKLYLWSKRWDDDVETPKAEDIKRPITELKDNTQDCNMSEDKPPELPDINLSQGSDKPCSQGSDEADLHPALKLPLSQSELEHLASSVENKLRATEESTMPAPATPVKAPEPEAAIQPAECRLVLLEHIERLQAKLEARLTELEARAEELEAKDADLCETEAGSPRTKETLRLLQRDLASVTKISNYVTPD